jgi:hypothetical protein
MIALVQLLAVQVQHAGEGKLLAGAVTGLVVEWNESDVKWGF